MKRRHIRVSYNVTGRGHNRTSPVYWEDGVVDIKELFKLAIKAFQTIYNKHNIDIDDFDTFYIMPCDENGMVEWDTSKFHGWRYGGKVSYPINK